MEPASTAVAVVSAAISAGSLAVARKARDNSKRSADVAAEVLHRAKAPRLSIVPEGTVARDATDIIYRVHNLEGPDLDSVVIHRPVLGSADDSTTYPVAVTGRSEYGDVAEIGPIALAQYGRFTFKLGSRGTLPEFRVRITCTVNGVPPWEMSEVLWTPRGS